MFGPVQGDGHCELYMKACNYFSLVGRLVDQLTFSSNDQLGIMNKACNNEYLSNKNSQ